ncbi:GPW/gp25 family protein [Burkholderia thailandensis]|uniref:Lysozyme family protein n=1 Tax=Burkholderia thailandensis TaxID=57975 RepID=A0AAW9D0P4_BURTH|nr:GPW/gp25 family protein [Burkholderia thailandensis]MCS3394150.1 GPW/gp25 family protein [Burkholderia thailandensis]MCS6427418.1 GPW/gp25 family protein [Burkholderia thailandensis]MCS6455652.1 GPW/gp25 family protein [Burkholderia thailandensis]MCS6466583.1 GPW/gp25 family protein [Burkholderia thailandensis]MCS6485234.1 GPW/gp25 family protein [Burkholderia thailandensis]
MSAARELVGMDRWSGAPLRGLAHLKQSIGDILSTRRGTRRERPEYGSDIPAMIDLPITRGWLSSAQAEAARAIGRWEPRIKLERVAALAVVDGRVTFEIRGRVDGNAEIFEVTV